MTFEINGTDFSGLITRYGYATAYNPVYTQSLMTLNGYEKVAYLRHRGSLTVTLRPLTSAELSVFTAALATGIMEIRYTCLQRNMDVIARMKLDGGDSAEMVLRNASRTLVGNTQLTFTEL